MIDCRGFQELFPCDYDSIRCRKTDREFSYCSDNDSTYLLGVRVETWRDGQEFAERFRAENGAIVCRELLGLACRKEEPVPAERTAEYYKKRPCVELVACAARIVGEYLQRQNAAPEKKLRAHALPQERTDHLP